jgi:hypothetical protein
LAICWGESNSTSPETGEKEGKEGKKKSMGIWRKLGGWKPSDEVFVSFSNTELWLLLV